VRADDAPGSIGVRSDLSHLASTLIHRAFHDTLARFGGDEFSVLLEGATEATAMACAERIRAALRAAADRRP
jgi:GGDEF domain-containing protein